jgi:hypothetical protein
LGTADKTLIINQLDLSNSMEGMFLRISTVAQIHYPQFKDNVTLLPYSSAIVFHSKQEESRIEFQTETLFEEFAEIM